MSTNDAITATTATTPTPWPTRDQVLAVLAEVREGGDLHRNWSAGLARLRQAAERHTALRAARELLERERPALAGETGSDPRPSAEMAVFDAIAKVGELETMALARYVRCAQAALEQAATGAAPASWYNPLPGEDPRTPDGDAVLPEPGEAPGDLRVPEALAEAPGVDLLHTALCGFAALESAARAWEDMFGCNDFCDELEEGCGGGPHIPEHMIDEANELEREMDRGPEYLAGYADAAAWTLTRGLRDRLRDHAHAGTGEPRGGGP